MNNETPHTDLLLSPLMEKFNEAGPAFILELEDEINRLKARLHRPRRLRPRMSAESLVAGLRVSIMDEFQY